MDAKGAENDENLDSVKKEEINKGGLSMFFNWSKRWFLLTVSKNYFLK